MKLAISGCGGHGANHAMLAQELGWQITALFDPAAAQPLARQLGSRPTICDSYPELLQSGAEAVLIASPDGDHATQLLLAVEAGLPVLVEKPLGCSPADLGAVRLALDLATRKGLIVTTCFIRRFDPPYVSVAKHLEDWIRELGELAFITLDFSYPAPRRAWKQEGRSLMMDHFPHEFDVVRFWLGRRGFQLQRVFDGPDAYYVSGDIENRIGIAFRGQRRLRPGVMPEKFYPETVELRFERGTVRVNTQTGRIYFQNDETQREEYHQDPASYKTDYDLRLRGVMQNFGDAIVGAALPYLTPDDLLTNTQTTVRLDTTGLDRYVA